MNIYILLDRSGSMMSKWDEAISSINGYIEELAKEKVMKKAVATIAVFDNFGGLSFDVLRDQHPIKKWVAIKPDEVIPRGTTPLHDAIGRLADRVGNDKPKKATVAIMTDGLENASREVSRKDAKSYLDLMRKKNFDVVFLGVDFDAFAQGASLGGAAGQTLNVDAGQFGAATRSFAGKTASYAATGKVSDWSDADRDAASDSTK